MNNNAQIKAKLHNKFKVSKNVHGHDDACDCGTWYHYRNMKYEKIHTFKISFLYVQ